METLLSVVVFVALFFLMMRFGCGSHMMHGRGKQAAGGHDVHGGGGCCGGMGQGKQDHDAAHAGAGAGAKEGGRDPVCGMQVSAADGVSTTHAGSTYWFCCKGCLDEFEAHPGRYVTAPESARGAEREATKGVGETA